MLLVWIEGFSRNFGKIYVYKEGEKYYFIHRSFQEYFTAVYFASGFDAKLINVGKFFDTNGARNYDKTFDMLYDMIPRKVERFIFMPYLEKLLAGKGRKAYWSFIETVFGHLYYNKATNLDCPPSGYSKPFLYEKIHNLIKSDLFDHVPCASSVDISTDAPDTEIYTELCVPYDPTGSDAYMGG